MVDLEDTDDSSESDSPRAKSLPDRLDKLRSPGSYCDPNPDPGPDTGVASGVEFDPAPFEVFSQAAIDACEQEKLNGNGVRAMAALAVAFEKKYGRQGASSSSCSLGERALAAVIAAEMEEQALMATGLPGISAGNPSQHVSRMRLAEHPIQRECENMRTVEAFSLGKEMAKHMDVTMDMEALQYFVPILRANWDMTSTQLEDCCAEQHTTMVAAGVINVASYTVDLFKSDVIWLRAQHEHLVRHRHRILSSYLVHMESIGQKIQSPTPHTFVPEEFALVYMKKHERDFAGNAEQTEKRARDLDDKLSRSQVGKRRSCKMHIYIYIYIYIFTYIYTYRYNYVYDYIYI
jgi:hypothetical protein